MTGRLVMYTVVLYLFPLHPDFTVNSQFISTMIALTGIPGTIVGIVLAKKLKRQITLFRFSGFAQSIAFFVMILTPSGAVATVCAILMGVVIFISTPSLLHPAGPDAGGEPAEGRRHYDAVLDGGVYPANDRLRRHRPPGQREHLEDGHALHRLLLPDLPGGYLPAAGLRQAQDAGGAGRKNR